MTKLTFFYLGEHKDKILFDLEYQIGYLFPLNMVMFL